MLHQPLLTVSPTLVIHARICMQVAQLHKTTAPLTFTYDQARPPTACMHKIAISTCTSASQLGLMCSQVHTASLRLLCRPGITWMISMHQQVFGAAASQSEVFAEAGLPLCRAVLEGFDGELGT